MKDSLKNKEIKVLVAGLGYIGLPTAALMASKGIRTLGYDINLSIIKKINKGKIHIVEPDLEGLVGRVVKKGFLKAVPEPEAADVFMITVPTPFKKGHRPDISFVESALRRIMPFIKEGNLIIIESTCPVGTTDKLSRMIYSRRPELKGRIFMAYCPERVLPGRILFELRNNDRAIGGVNGPSAEKTKDFYSRFVKGSLYKTDAKTAEMCKLAENSYRDVNIAFANEISLLCENFGIDPWELIELANRHPRVNILKPGPGVGGHCIAVDPWFLVSAARRDAKIIRTAREVNDSRPHIVVENLRKSLVKAPNRAVAFFGCTYKADIGDVRESPALAIIAEAVLRRVVSDAYIVEPHIASLPETLASLRGVKLSSLKEALAKSSAVVLLVDHKEFLNIGAKSLEGKIVIDTKGSWRKPQ